MSHRATERAAASVRAELARRKMSAQQLGRELGWTRNKTRRRINGEHPMTLDELVQIADHLSLSLTYLTLEMSDAA